MPCQDLPFRIEFGADRLSHANEDAARQRTPQTAEAADNDGLEGVEQARRAYGGVEIGAHTELESRHGDHDHGDGSDQREDDAIVDPHELGHFGIVGSGTEAAADLGPMNQMVEDQDYTNRRDQRQQLRGADSDTAAKRDGVGLDGSRSEPLAVGREDLEK